MSVHARARSRLIAACLCALAGSAAAHAADTIRYVSTTGSNSNDCTLAAPCRTLQRGINETPAGGELRILDSGGYGGAPTIDKSMTIAGNGNTVLLGVTINEADAVVTLRGLTLDGQGETTYGIHIIAAAAVHIERCIVHGFADKGIRAGSSAVGVKVFVLNSVSRNNGDDGLYFFAGTASRLTVDDSQFDNNASFGIAILGGRAVVNRSTFSGNGSTGFTVSSASVTAMWTVAAQNQSAGFSAGTGGILTLEYSLSHGNTARGLEIGTGAIVRMSNSTIVGNSSAINNNGNLLSRGNNNVSGTVGGNAKVPVAGF